MKTSVKDIAVFTNLVANDPALQNKLKEDPVGTLQQFEPPAGRKDFLVYRIVVGALSLTLLVIVIGVFAKADTLETKTNIVTIITALGSASIGALAGLLAPTPTEQ